LALCHVSKRKGIIIPCLIAAGIVGQFIPCDADKPSFPYISRKSSAKRLACRSVSNAIPFLFCKQVFDVEAVLRMLLRKSFRYAGVQDFEHCVPDLLGEFT
jgi:hypothetical protein